MAIGGGLVLVGLVLAIVGFRSSSRYSVLPLFAGALILGRGLALLLKF